MAGNKNNFNESSISSLSNGINEMENINSSTTSQPFENDEYQNLITYELHRINTNIGFGFDLKGEKPAMVGSVRKDSIADQAGLREGDLVISINNKKVTDLDHDHVVRLVGLTKRTLMLQVTKVKYLSNSAINNACFMGNSHRQVINTQQIYQNLPSHLNHKVVKSTSKKLNRKLLKHTASLNDQIPTAASLMYTNPDDNFNSNSLTNNTKTTEDDEDDSDCDFDYYLMTGRRRRNRRHHHHHHSHRDHHHKHFNPKMPGRRLISTLNTIKPVVGSYLGSQTEKYEEYEDYEDDDTEDTEDTENTEEDLNVYHEYRGRTISNNSNNIFYKIHRSNSQQQYQTNPIVNNGANQYRAHQLNHVSNFQIIIVLLLCCYK